MISFTGATNVQVDPFGNMLNLDGHLLPLSTEDKKQKILKQNAELKPQVCFVVLQ